MRNPWRLTVGAILLSAISFFLLTPVEAVSESAGEAPHPKLVVMVVFDQMRGDYLKKWQPLFGEGGFKRLQTEGAWFTNCHYPYAYTLTAPGHTSLSTGTSPYKHGIIANDWYDRAHGENVASVTPPPQDEAKGSGPYRRRVESVGDVLLRVLMGKGRVASMSIKDRAAILMAAMRAQLCYWFSSKSGNFQTSAYYRPDPHSWVVKFNKARHADQWLDKPWERLHANLDYVKHSGPDDFLSEGSGYGQGRTFPHHFKLGAGTDAKKAKENYYDAVVNSPMGSELLLQFAKAAIDNEKLGQGDTVDLLCLSFSSNDAIGHCWGPDSHEVLDVTLRSDALMKDLLDFLDARVGKGNYYLALSADHGVCPLPEFAKGKPAYDDPARIVMDAQRIDPDILTSRVEEFLSKKFAVKKVPWLEQPRKGNPWLYFNRATLKELNLRQQDVETVAAEWFSTQPGIERAFTRSEFMQSKLPSTTENDLFASVRRSFDADNSGDVMVIIKPYHLFSPPTLTKNPDKLSTFRTTHGTPHVYDTHVPLLVMGPRIVPGVRDIRVQPQAMASIVAEALGVPPPAAAEYPVPGGLFRK